MHIDARIAHGMLFLSERALEMLQAHIPDGAGWQSLDDLSITGLAAHNMIPVELDPELPCNVPDDRPGASWTLEQWSAGLKDLRP